MHRFASGFLVSAMLLAPWSGSAAEEASGRASGGAYISDEVTLRIVAEEPEADGTIRAALLVELAPGWKTYWIDPGEAGIPPRIDLTESRNVATDGIAFPAPHRFGDQYATSNGYSAPFAVALRLREVLPGEATDIRASVTMGVCQQICIPVSAELALLPEESGVGGTAVGDAFAALPMPSDAENGVDAATLSADGKTLAISTRFATETSAVADLFLAGPKGWHFGAPTAAKREGSALDFTVPVLESPRKPSPEQLVVDVVLTSGTRSIEKKGVAIVNASGTAVVPGN